MNSSEPLSSPQLSDNDSLPLSLGNNQKSEGAKFLTIGRARNCIDANLAQIVCDKDGVVDWYIVQEEMLLARFEECWPLPTESLSVNSL